MANAKELTKVSKAAAKPLSKEYQQLVVSFDGGWGRTPTGARAGLTAANGSGSSRRNSAVSVGTKR